MSKALRDEQARQEQVGARRVLREELRGAVVLDVCGSYLLQLTSTEHPPCTGNASVSKTRSKHPLKGSGCIIHHLNRAPSGQERSLSEAPMETEGMTFWKKCHFPAVGKIVQLSALQFCRL